MNSAESRCTTESFKKFEPVKVYGLVGKFVKRNSLKILISQVRSIVFNIIFVIKIDLLQ